MALVVFDRVQETTTTSGTGSVTLLGAVSGFQSFAVVGNGNTTFYTITDGAAWEVGIGTYSTSGPTLARTTVLSNSNGNTSPITLSGGLAQVFLTYPAEKSVNLDASGNVTPLGTIASGTWQGTTVGVSYGGTGVTASSGANSVVLRDSNQNTRINNVIQGWASTVSAAGTTTLTAASAYWQRLTGTTTQTFQLPDATTLVDGTSYIFDNDSTGNLYITNNGGGAVDTVPGGGYVTVFLESNSTSNGVWGKFTMLPSTVDWGTSSADLGGTTLSNATWQGNTIATGYGGTGLTSFTSGGALYATSTSALTSGTLPVTAGGSGATTLSGYVYGNGTSAFTASSTIPGSDISGNISGDAANVTGTVLVTHGGTGLTSVPQYYVPFGDTSTALTTSQYFQFNGSTLRVGNQTLLAGATNPIIGQTGSFNSYIQTYIYNANTGTSASADLTAYPDNGSDASGWVDMGVTSSTYNDAAYSVTGPNEAYLLGSAPSGASKTGNLVLATDSTGTANSIQFYVGGFNQAKGSWKAQLTTTGLQLANALGVSYGGTGQSSYTDGQLLIGNSTGNTLTKATLTAGTGISITNGSGSISIASTVTSGLTITNDTSTATALYPTFTSATSGSISGASVTSTKFKFVPSTGTMTASNLEASNGMITNSATVSTNYSIPSGSNAIAVGPVTVAAGAAVTIPAGSRWLVL